MGHSKLSPLFFRAALLVLATLAGCQQAAEEKTVATVTTDTRPSILLITIDTLRADHLGIYGYERDTSPFFDELSQQATLWDNAFSTSSWTVPAMVSLHTGVAPQSHGVLHGVVINDEVVEQEVLPEHLPMLAEILREEGYTTFGVVTNPHLAGERGFVRGFDHFEEHSNGTAADVNAIVAGWQEQLEDGPVFLWLHYFDPHNPYYPRSPQFEEYSAGLDVTESELKLVAQAQDEWPKIPFALLVRPQRTINIVRDLYDSEIRYLDDHLRQLFEIAPMLDDYVLLMTADHGEEFREHGKMGHGRNLFNETVHIPLLIRAPDVPPGRLQQTVSLTDLPVTVLGFAQAQVPAGWHGIDLRSEPDVATDRPVLAHLSRFPDRAHLTSMVWLGYKLIRDVRSGRSSLFDLAEDPGEEIDLAPTEKDLVSRMEARLDDILGALPKAPETKTLTAFEDHIEDLRALGYVE